MAEMANRSPILEGRTAGRSEKKNLTTIQMVTMIHLLLPER